MGLLNIKTLLTLRDSIREIKDLYFDRVNMEGGKMKHESTFLCRMGRSVFLDKKKVIIMLSPHLMETLRHLAVLLRTAWFSFLNHGP